MREEREREERLRLLLVVDDADAQQAAFRPLFEAALAAEPKLSNALLVYVDVDEAAELATAYGASALPLFVLLRGGKKVETLVGAQKTALRKAVVKHLPAEIN